MILDKIKNIPQPIIISLFLIQNPTNEKQPPCNTPMASCSIIGVSP
jgi:hypothetical protein